MEKDLVKDSHTSDQSLEKLLISKEPYYEHLEIDIDNDSNSEVVIISKSQEYSDYLSMFDTTCVYMEIAIYKNKNDKWKSVNEYKLADFKNTDICTDSFSNLIVKRNFKPSGLSEQQNIETYKYSMNEFYLQKIDITIRTKLNSNFDTNNDIWNYQFDFDSKQLNVRHSKLRLLEDNNGDKYLSDSDTSYQKLISQDLTIPLGKKYKLDTIIGEQNMIHFF